MGGDRINKILERSHEYNSFVTIGRLRRIIEESNLPDTANIYVQRIPDMYFNEHGWEVVKRDNSYSLDQSLSGEDRESLKDEFIIQVSAFADEDGLYITAHC